jgi:hypothetical protein
VIVHQLDVRGETYRASRAKGERKTRRSALHRHTGHDEAAVSYSIITAMDDRAARSHVRMLCRSARRSCVNTRRVHRRLRDTVG